MPLKSGETSISGSISCTYVKTVTGYAPAAQKPALSFSFAPDAAVFNYPLLGSWSILAGGSQTVDVLALISSMGESVTVTKAIGLILVGTATVVGGQLQIQPDTTNPLVWFFGAATGSRLVFNVSIDRTGCACLLVDGTAVTVSATARNLKLSNPGTQTITVKLLAIVGDT